MAEAFDWDKDATDADGFDWDGLEDAPEEKASAKTLPQGRTAATLKALAASPLFSAAGRVLGATGAIDAPIQRAGAQKVGAGETALNKAVNTVPLGGLATDAGTAGSLLLARAAGKVAPDASRVLSGLVGRNLPEWAQLSPVPGPGATLTAQALKELEALGVDTKQPEAPGLLDTYRNARNTRRTRTEAGDEQNPLAALGGSAGGLALSMVAPLPRFMPRGGEQAGTLARMSAGAKTGGAYGALAGLTSGDADLAGGEFGKATAEAGIGLLGGAALGGAIPGAVGLGQRLLRGVVRPTAAAEALEREGVEGLTLGQMAGPESGIGRFEGAAQVNPVFGPILRGQRAAPEESWRNVVANTSRAPGAAPVPPGTAMPQAMQLLDEGYGEIYKAVREASVPAYRLGGVLGRVTDPATKLEAGATTPDVRRATDFVRTQLSRLPKEDEVVSGRLVLEVRKNLNRAIREELNKAEPNFPYARILQQADDELSNGLEASLPEELASALRATDRQYRNFKILQQAEVAAGDTAQGQGVFSPKRLVTAVKRSTPEYVYDKGGGGPLRTLAANAVQAFDEPPRTGYTPAMAGGPLGYFTTPFMAMANAPAPKRFLLGRTPLQQNLQRSADDLAPLLELLNPPQTFLPQFVAEASRNPRETP